jgi:hypothetical protein
MYLISDLTAIPWFVHYGGLGADKRCDVTEGNARDSERAYCVCRWASWAPLIPASLKTSQGLTKLSVRQELSKSGDSFCPHVGSYGGVGALPSCSAHTFV